MMPGREKNPGFFRTSKKIPRFSMLVKSAQWRWCITFILLLNEAFAATSRKLAKNGGSNVKKAKAKDISTAKKIGAEGFSLLEQRKFEQAAAKFEAAVAVDPTYSDYHTQLATCFRVLGHAAKAVEEYKLAISYMNETRNRDGGDQYWSAVHINLGYMYAEGGGEGLFPGAMPLAAEMFSMATKLQPKMAEAYTYLGNAYQEMKRWGDALAVFETAIRKVTSRDDPERLGYQNFHLANCHGQLGQTDQSLKADAYHTHILKLMYST
jgi:tetratricopeptide (TPR) repeat protein